MQTRINELDVINGLFRGRVTELEASQQDARNNEMAARESERVIRLELEASMAREAELKRRIEELEGELGPKAKRIRLSDYVEDRSQASTPVSTTS
jgi:GATA-binding protein